MSRRRYTSFLAISFLTVTSLIVMRLVVGGYLLASSAPQSVAARAANLNREETVGLFRNGTFLLKNTLDAGPADEVVALGTGRMTPLIGDWNGDGIDSVGVYDPVEGRFYLQNANRTSAPLAFNFLFGPTGGIAAAGDWSGNGHDSVAVFVSGVFYIKNILGPGPADESMTFGVRGDIPVAGDWTGRGRDSLGVYRPSTGQFFLTESLCTCHASPSYVVTFGPVNSKPFTGVWTHVGHDGLGVLNAATGKVYLKNESVKGGIADFVFSYGEPVDWPVAGHWTAAGGG